MNSQLIREIFFCVDYIIVRMDGCVWQPEINENVILCYGDYQWSMEGQIYGKEEIPRAWLPIRDSLTGLNQDCLAGMSPCHWSLGNAGRGICVVLAPCAGEPSRWKTKLFLSK